MKILCVHPNNELYGSDRSFLQALAAVREADPAGSLEVRLVSEGPISPHVAKVSTKVLYGPMWVLRKAKIKQIVAGAPVTFPLAVLRARQQIKASGCDLLYINTLVPIDYLFAARMMKKGKAICHVREIPTGAAMKVFSWILKISGCRVVYNSEATRDAFDFKGAVDETVIYNGVPSPENVEAPQPQDRLKVLLIGRFNSWKGQTVLVRALASLPPEQRARIDVRLVGGVYSDQNHFIDTVKAEIEKAGLQERVTLHPFIADPSEHFRWADVFAVPSTLPEPFGRVAIEGMSFKRPVIATNHGGLAEIVEHGRTGILVEPGSETSLAAALSEFLADPSKVRTMGEAGYERFNTLFSEEVYQQNMLGLFGLSRDAR